MSQRIVRDGIALIGAAAILVAAGWLDTHVFREIQRGVSNSFDYSTLAWALPFGYLMVAVAVVAVAGLAAWARSLLVGVVYAVVGAFFAFLFTITWLFASEINGVQPILPRPLATIIGDMWTWGAEGPLQAMSIIGAGMLLAGLASIAFVVFRRAGRASETEAAPGST